MSLLMHTDAFCYHFFYGFACQTKEEVRVGNYGNRVIQEDKESILMARWRFPSLTIHGIHGAFRGEGVRKVVSAKVTGEIQHP